LIRGNVIAEGFVRVKKLPPTVVAPRFVRAVPVFAKSDKLLAIFNASGSVSVYEVK
jgi:hypothetical protein